MSKHDVLLKHASSQWTWLLAAVQVVRRVFRPRRRRLSPITRLPNELLSHVFSFLADEETPWGISRVPPPRPFSLGWIEVTHVCRRWRKVALDDSQLWSDITFDLGHEWTREMIARAKQAPLDIHSENEAEALLALVMPGHLSHTRSLHILGADPNVVHSLTAAAPILERVTLHCPMVDINTVTILPEDIFAFHAPRLRMAAFDGFKFPWSSPILRDLLQLEVTIPRQVFTSLPSHREFFDALANMPYLESLTISWALPTLAAITVEPQRRKSIMLPHLQKLMLEGPWFDVVDVLEVIQFPALTKLEFCFFAEEDDDEPVSVIDPLLQRYRDMAPGVNLRTHLRSEFGRGLKSWTYTQRPRRSAAGR